MDDGRVFPPNPALETADRLRMAHPPYLFPSDRLYDIGEMLGRLLIERKQQQILALTVQTWHIHFVVSDSDRPIGDIVKCAKDAVRYGLQENRPIWSHGYDKRFCVDESSLQARIKYVERHHNPAARAWSFVLAPGQ